MPRDTLLDFFDDLSEQTEEFLIYDNGYQTRSYSYSQIFSAARDFQKKLSKANLSKGDKALIWSENRPEWIISLWGCLLQGVILVPIDYRASEEFVLKVRRIVRARLILVGEEVSKPSLENEFEVWNIRNTTTIPFHPHIKGQNTSKTKQDTQQLDRDDIAEIIFTSGATSEPKGVVITHRNILANIIPIEREVQHYKHYIRFFFSIKFLNLLPLSHMFGQAMATFIPPMLPGAVIFMRGHNPTEIIRQIKKRQVSVLVCVPKILEVLRDHIIRLIPEAANPTSSPPHWMIRWWRYRKIHRLLGWKFCSFIVGAAPLDPTLEEFWSRLGYLVIQGYGLTETAPIVTLNHPFKSKRGTVGKPISGVEVQIAEDGEILVRGENVTSGYYQTDAVNNSVFENGWFHTGDVGSFDDEGRLKIRGRKKEMIVTPEGLNVFPEDIEKALNCEPGIHETAIVGIFQNGKERVHAVLVINEESDPDAVIRRTNRKLEDHQKIRSFSLWPTDNLPRTEGTQKLKRHEIKCWVEDGRTPRTHEPVTSDTIASVITGYTNNRTITPETTFDELGLSSLERLEVMMTIEARYRTTLDEASFSSVSSIAELQKLVTEPKPSSEVQESYNFPIWNRNLLVRTIRRLSLATWLLPLTKLFARIRVDGLQHLRALNEPVVFASNHQSHLDTPVILAALPPQWRYRTAVAMAKEFFKAHFHPEGLTWDTRLTSSLNYYLATFFFNTFPLPQREIGTRRTLRYMGELAEEGLSILIFPEGRRTDYGEINSFRPGIGMIGVRLGLPIVPVRIEGLDKVLHHSWHMAKPGRVHVTFGEPIRTSGEDYTKLTASVQEAVSRL